VQPADTDTLKDSTTLLANVAEVSQVFKFNPTTKAFEYMLRMPSGPPFGTNFALDAGKGFVIKATAPKNVTFAGTALASAESTLVKGQLRGLPDGGLGADGRAGFSVPTPRSRSRSSSGTTTRSRSSS
jgi:hypothetical protein